MAQLNNKRISAQAVGAYGEKAVEAELLRRGWLPSNVNASVKNAVNFDIFALKNDRTVLLRVKTCGPGMTEFQFSFRPAQEIAPKNFTRADFTILVAMGQARQNDQFYILQTCDVRDAIDKHRDSYLKVAKRDGATRKDVGHWTLHLQALKSGEDRPGYDLAKKWEKYRDNWALLEQ